MNATPTTGSQRIRFDHPRFLLPSVSFLAAIILWSHAYALTINPIFDVTITGDPQAATIEAEIISAISVYESTFSDPITVTINFREQSTGLGNSGWGLQPFSYSSYRAALVSHATTADDATALASLPNGANNPVNNNANVNLHLPLARALGFSADPGPGQPDGSIALNTSIMNYTRTSIDPNKYSLFAVVSHEIDEVLGFSSALNGLTNGAATPTGPVDPEDLFRYAQNGSRSFTTALASAAYFSLDGTTDLARFNQTQGGDFADWYSPGGQTPQVQDAFGTAGSTPVLAVELRVLDAIGFHRGVDPVWVDFTFNGSPKLGTYNNPYQTLLAGANAIFPGGLVLMKGNRSSLEAMPLTISKAMTLQAVGGPATIGQ
jgi:hypothetical protein